MLADNPLCHLCEQRGIVRIATERDHIIPLCDGGQDTLKNTQMICSDCHRRKTIEEAKERQGG